MYPGKEVIVILGAFGSETAPLVSGSFCGYNLSLHPASLTPAPGTFNPPSMSKDCERLWKKVMKANDEGNAIQILLEILSDKEGRDFITNLEKEDAKFCIEILDDVSRNPHSPPVLSHLRLFCQAIVDYKLRSAEKQAFFLALMRLTGAQGRLPDSMTITDNIDVEEGILALGGFADVRCGTYQGCRVAVKTLRVSEYDNVEKIRKVGICAISAN